MYKQLITKAKSRIFLILSVGLVSGCANLIDHREAAFARATEAQFVIESLRVGDFDLVTFHRGLAGARFISVYIEGDGRVARTRTRLSDNPTPRTPVALDLALADPSPAVLYLARPCQYLTETQLTRCHPRYWSLARYSEPVVAATNQAIDWALRATLVPDATVGLVGYSGGGAIAALVAARRSDVDWLITVAGNLDHEAWTAIHSLTPLHDSLNPVDFVEALTPIPQLHLVGEKDKNLTIAVAKSYLRAFSDQRQISLRSVPDFTHHCCWRELWPEVLCSFPPATTACPAL